MMPLYINSEAGDVSRLLMSSDGFVEGRAELMAFLAVPMVRQVNRCHESGF